MPRCSCSPVPDEFARTYASVLVGDLEAKVLALEQGPLMPCVTSWCPKCCRPCCHFSTPPPRTTRTWWRWQGRCKTGKVPRIKAGEWLWESMF